MAKIGIREAVRLAKLNGAALIECSDLEQLYGGDTEVEGNEDVMTKAQERVVEFLRVSAEGRRSERKKL